MIDVKIYNITDGSIVTGKLRDDPFDTDISAILGEPAQEYVSLVTTDIYEICSIRKIPKLLIIGNPLAVNASIKKRVSCTLNDEEVKSLISAFNAIEKWRLA